MTQKQPRLRWFGFGLLTGLAGGWWLSRRRSTNARMPFLNVWQRELGKTRGPVDAALLAGRVQAHYDDLWARHPHFTHPVLNWHVRASILPGLALYQVLREEHETQTAALAEAEKLIAVILTKQALPFPLLKRLPDPFAVFRLACRWMLRLAFPTPGWNTTFVEDTPDCLAFEVHDQCIYQKILTDFGAPELTAVFCQMDDLVYSQLAPEIIFTHDKTIGRGDEYCSFRYCRGNAAPTVDMAQTDVQQLNDVSETLLLPLAYRAAESRRPDALIQDPRAAEITAQLKYDFSKLERQQFQQMNVSLRVREFDRAVRTFLETHPDGVVVDIGCGLDTRFERVDNGHVTWFNLDFPEVIALRERFFAPHPRCHTLACSALEFTWMDEVAQHPGPYFFVAEGVFPYLTEDEIRRLVYALRERFPGAELIFDALPALMMRAGRLHPSIRQTRAARVRWATNDSHVMERWGVGRLLDVWRYYEQDEPRLGWYKVFRYIPFLRDFRVLRYRLSSDVV